MIPFDALRDSPALLKLDLYCRGAVLDESCFIEEDGGRRILRTRAGLGSGLEAILPGGLWTNIPVSEPFAKRSDYVVRRRRGQYLLTRGQDTVAELRLSPRPSWYDREASTGRAMTRVGTLQGTYLGVYQAAADRRSRPGLLPSLRGVHGARPADRLRPERESQPGAPAGGVRVAQPPPLPPARSAPPGPEDGRGVHLRRRFARHDALRCSVAVH